MARWRKIVESMLVVTILVMMTSPCAASLVGSDSVSSELTSSRFAESSEASSPEISEWKIDFELLSETAAGTSTQCDAVGTELSAAVIFPKSLMSSFWVNFFVNSIRETLLKPPKSVLGNSKCQ